MARPKPELETSDDERQTLTRRARRPKSTPRLATRARIVRACADEPSNKAVAERLGGGAATVGTWWNRLVARRLDGLADEFKLSTDPYFVEKVRDIVGLYTAPPEKAVVLCIDEKPQVQALERTQPVLPMAPARTERVTHDYTRHGTTSLLAAPDEATGKVIGHNAHPKPFVWTADADAILDRINRVCERTSDSGREAGCNFIRLCTLLVIGLRRAPGKPTVRLRTRCSLGQVQQSVAVSSRREVRVVP